MKHGGKYFNKLDYFRLASTTRDLCYILNGSSGELGLTDRPAGEIAVIGGTESAASLPLFGGYQYFATLRTVPQ
jgi:hypothetical protein